MVSSPCGDVVSVSNDQKAISTNETVEQSTPTFAVEESKMTLRHGQLVWLDELLNDESN